MQFYRKSMLHWDHEYLEKENNLLFNKTTICIEVCMYLLNHTVVISKQGKRGESGIFSLPETTCKLLQPALRIVIIYDHNDKRLKKGLHPAHSVLILRISFGKYMTFLASFRHSKRKYFLLIIKVSPKSWTWFFFRNFSEWNSQFQITVQG